LGRENLTKLIFSYFIMNLLIRAIVWEAVFDIKKPNLN
jgi:hypothetical protein